MRKVNKVLRRNRRILAELAPDGKNFATRTRLDDRGFSFKYFTHLSPSRDGQRYTWIYEFGYLEIRDNYFMIVHRPEDWRAPRGGKSAVRDGDPASGQP